MSIFCKAETCTKTKDCIHAFMQSIISNPAFKQVYNKEHCMDKSAILADLFAKALIRQLKKEQK